MRSSERNITESCRVIMKTVKAELRVNGELENEEKLSCFTRLNEANRVSTAATQPSAPPLVPVCWSALLHIVVISLNLLSFRIISGKTMLPCFLECGTHMVHR